MRIVLAAVMTTVALEAFLQLGALVVWLGQRGPETDVPPGQDVVLCIGDSWTEGMGSSNPAKHSYPAVLQSLVRERSSLSWTVVNGGQAGQNSRDVLQRLPSQLDQYRPRIVCLLVGGNDFWSLPHELPVDATLTHDAYRFRWRIPRLITWLVASANNEPGAAHAESRAGPDWQSRRPEPDKIYKTEKRKWRTPQAARHLLQEGRRLARTKKFVDAIEQFEAARKLAPEDAMIHAMLVAAYWSSGQQDRATARVEWLLASWERERDYWTGKALVSALSECGRFEEVLDCSTDLLARFPNDSALHRSRGHAEFQLGRFAAARASLEKAIALVPTPAAYRLLRKVQLRLENKDAAIRAIFRAYAHFNDHVQASNELLGVLPRVEQAQVDRLLMEFECAEATRTRLRQIVTKAFDDSRGDRAKTVLWGHLARIDELVRQAGAQLVLLNYPIASRAQQPLRLAAAAGQVKFIDVFTRVQQLLGDRSIAKLRSPDGHVDDEGYRLMAQAVVEGLAELLDR